MNENTSEQVAEHGIRSHAEVDSFITDIGGRLGQESPESFAESYRDEYRDTALELYQTYMVVVVESLEMLGIAGYSRVGKLTHHDIINLIQKQRNVRAGLIELDETKISILKAPDKSLRETL